MRKKLLSLLVLLMTAVTGAWADTTVKWEGTKLQSIAVSKGYNTNVTTESMTVDGITITAKNGYLKNDLEEGVVLHSGAANGVVFSAENNIKSITITSTGFSKFTPDGDFQFGGGSHTYEVSPAATSYGCPTDVMIEGITKIEITLEGAPAPASYNVTATSAGGAYWATFYTEAGNYQAPEGTQVFAVNLNTSTAKITMTEISDRIAKSGQGVVLKNTTTGSITMSKTETAPAGDYSGSSLTGTMTSITNPGNAYVLNYKAATGVGFYKLSSGGTIGANKAYLTYSGGGLSAPSFFGFDGNTTGIDATLVNSEKVNSVVYDLQGRRVAQPTKGLYIVNGKKVFINK